jgi:hypothetical protein
MAGDADTLADKDGKPYKDSPAYRVEGEKGENVALIIAPATDPSIRSQALSSVLFGVPWMTTIPDIMAHSAPIEARSVVPCMKRVTYDAATYARSATRAY